MISVVIPCYRCGETIRRAVISVRNQILRPAEVILVDDSSGDDTAATLLQLVAQLHGSTRPRVISLPQNVGAAGARNAGWNAAAEKYVAFLDADASWHPEKLKVQLAYMEEHPDVAISGHWHAVSHRATPLGAGARMAAPVTFDNLLWSNRFAMSSAMVRRELPLRMPEGQRYMEDHRFLLEVARAGHKITCIESVLAAHHKPEFGASGLSAELMSMQKGELSNYRALYQAGAVSAIKYCMLQAWSVAKFARRAAIVGARRLRTARTPGQRL